VIEYVRDGHVQAALLDRVEPEGVEGVPDGGPPIGGLRALASPTGSEASGCEGRQELRGAGVLEVVEDDDGNTYRVVSTVKFAGAVYVFHTFSKKSKRGIKTPTAELDIIRRRFKAAEEVHARRQTDAEAEGEPGHH
jgi:hypothetical protein